MFDYYGTKWKRKRKRILRLDGYICQISKRYGRTEEATVVHHIYPADEYPEWAWEDWNLISVSLATHNKLENRKTGTGDTATEANDAGRGLEKEEWMTLDNLLKIVKYITGQWIE